MSRGPGKIQEAILQSLQAFEGEMTVETMRWELFEELNNRPHAQNLPNSWNTSVARAAKGLKDQGFVEITPRPLKSFEECVRHYPSKTMQFEKRALRTRFLPILRGCTEGPDGVASRYGVAANEEFHLKQLPRGVREELASRWARLEKSLQPIYGQATRSADDILSLICKGRCLFRCSDIEVNTSLRSAIVCVCRKNLVPSNLADDLQDFYKSFLSEEDAGLLQLKSFVRSVAEVPRHGQCSLRPAALKFLHDRDREYVKSMPGFKENKNRFGSGSDWFQTVPTNLFFPRDL